MLLLLLLEICLRASAQEQTLPPGRCDVPQREETFTDCTSCAAAATAAARCPRGFSPVRTANCSYEVAVGGRLLLLGGCSRLCVRSVLQPRCCPGRWGPLCLPCPSWSGRTCNFHGVCADGDTGNGTCVCEEGFSGHACQECKNPNKYGQNCDKECDCERGVCRGGPDGDGRCLCQPPYAGTRCDQVSGGCRSCGPYSYCRGEAEDAACECLPGYSMQNNKCSAVCYPKDCHPNAGCSSVGTATVGCACLHGYHGDGRVCVPQNPCLENQGGCPPNSTVCRFRGPKRSSCECMAGMVPLAPSGDPDLGCRLVSACSPDTCHHTAVCETLLSGEARCVCTQRQIGDGWRCYGNLMERILELDSIGNQRENLTGAVALFEGGCSLLLSHGGPFTAFVPLLKAPLTGVDEEAVCKNHLILGQHLLEDLQGKDFSLYGGGKLRAKANQRFILMDNPRKSYTVLQSDLPAANGIIHIIDQPIRSSPTSSSRRDELFTIGTIGEILKKYPQFNRFLSLVDNCGSPPPLRSRGPLTVFVPTNEAVDRSRDGSLLYMLHDAKHKLQEMLRHHVYSRGHLSKDDLAALPRIQTMANQFVSISVSDDGSILLGDKGVRLSGPSIIGTNGIIHMMEGLLYPPSILPILPHRCDSNQSKITMGPCVHCSYLHQTHCPEGSTEMEAHQIGCEYVTSPLRQSLSKGCAKYCNTTKQVAECCKGFFGPDCKPCVGGFQHPCYDKGECSDGMAGNGSCSCHSGFRGLFCHICSHPARHGENCDEECVCVHGVCDNRPGSGGVCLRGSCLDGFSGELCDRRAVPCGADGRLQHCHLQADCSTSGLSATCVCRYGYRGDGHSCTPINPCLETSRGGCHGNAECVFVGPGNASCVCAEGWTGDGRACAEINNCQQESRGGCSPNADCLHLGPAQSECVCKTGFMGDGKVCDLINPCLRGNGGCHDLAKCELKEGGVHTCTCPDGYAGDGTTCYGSLLEELDMNPKLYSFYRLIQKSSQASEDLGGNLTVLAPSTAALRNMRAAENAFWTSRHRLPLFLRAHFLPGLYSVEDLDGLVGSRLPTLNPPTQWEVRNRSGVIKIGNASIITPNLPAINGYIHIVNQVLMPSTSDLPPEPPTLMAFLNSSSNFSLFRRYALMYNLTERLEGADFTVLLPTDAAVRRRLSATNSSQLDSEVFQYHVIPGVLLFPDRLYDGIVTSSLLGADHQLQFHIDQQNQTAVNGVLLDGSFAETQRGVLLFVPQVLNVQRNRCSKPIYLQVNGRCTDCDGPPRCLFNSKPIREQFPANMQSNCYFGKRVGVRRRTVPGCFIKCLRTTTDHSCCPGYYGHECFKCPGDVGSWCSNHGECQDGNHGNGECRCYEGFHGTNCEDCEPGRYGANCSSKCVCDHGKCEDGLAGGGGCSCYKGWKGASCSVEIRNDACGGACDENANCVTGPEGSAAACVCVAGYEGNGTSCRELDLCSRSNGGCSEFAVCMKVSAGERTCSCGKGYTGDGVVCLEVDGCLVKNGGCHRDADCIRTGPNVTACRCRSGFQGSGRFCYPVNPCKTNNGGCSKYARCEYAGRGQRNCSCLRGHIGDGLDCRGTTNNEVYRRPENAFFRQMLLKSDSPGIYGDGPFTVFVPLEESNNISTVEAWKRSGRLDDLVRYHFLSCEVLTLSDLKTSGRAVAVSGHTLKFSLQQGSVWINNSSRIVRSDLTTSNGVIHHVDRLLTPYRLQDRPPLEPKGMNFSTAASVYGYTKFYKLIELSGMLPVLQMSIHKPFTIFMPTDEALDGLPPARSAWLANADHQGQLAHLVKAHIIRNSKITRVAQPGKSSSSFRTMHGSTIKFSCDRKLVGRVLINQDAARVVERHLGFRDGLAFGIDQLLEPPGLGAFCDRLENKTTHGRCGSCFFPPPCPLNHVSMQRTERCFRKQHRFGGRRYPLFHSLDEPWSRSGCQRVCQYPSWTQSCCPNHHGRDCQACPGGVEAPCGRHGKCDDGVRGSGLCKCEKGFTGKSCESCAEGHYGANCTACSCGGRGRCDQGPEGSGACLCQPGWTGERCQLDLGSIPEECRRCHAEAQCILGTGCRCKPGFQGNGSFCSPEPPPDLCSEYNGGCHANARCNQTGLQVNCTCLSGYQGDGVSCQPINRCVEQPNGGCSDFALCRFTGPNERECECLPGFVGNGVQCLEKAVPPVDRCLEENGGCHPEANCHDLHYHGNTAGVFHLRSPEGKYSLNYSQAETACRAEGAILASYKQLGDAQQVGMHLCVAGWIRGGGRAGYPIRFPSARCGDNQVGLVMYKDPVDPSSKYDAYCYRLKDVSCSCPDGFVGNGDFCHGVLTSVLASYSNFSIFYKTLSGRDLEYHFSTNHSRRLLEALRLQGAIASRLGFNLTVTDGNNGSSPLVNQRRLLVWDVPAVNGIIHVLEAPLKAPPPPAPPPPVTAGGSAHSGGALAAAVAFPLLAVVMAALAYYAFRNKMDAFRFHYFKNEDEDAMATGGGGGKPTLVSIPNPLYSGSRAFTEPFGETSPGTEPIQPEEPPKILDLDQ
ncbi:LOW QUALITY PROTEIN: stabilin-1 [Menidia menidia]